MFDIKFAAASNELNRLRRRVFSFSAVHYLSKFSAIVISDVRFVEKLLIFPFYCSNQNHFVISNQSYSSKPSALSATHSELTRIFSSDTLSIDAEGVLLS